MRWLHAAYMTLFAAVLVFGDSASAQTVLEVRTKDGREFQADSIQTFGDVLLVKSRGVSPIEIAISNVDCLGTGCSSAVLSPSPVSIETKTPPARVGVRGSNEIGEKLMPAILRKYAESLPSGEFLARPGAAAGEQTIVLSSGGRPRASIDLAARGSDTAFEALLDGTAVIGMSGHAIEPGEVEKLRGRHKANMLSPESEHVLALDGLAVIVNAANPVRDTPFSLATIARIFGGEITDWSQVGGRPGPVAIHASVEASGAAVSFNDLVMTPAKAAIPSRARRHESSETLSEAVAKDPNAIGFAGVRYAGANRALAIGLPCGLAYKPTRHAIQTEVYPLSRRLYLYTAGPPQDPAARNILAFSSSGAAQAAARSEGFVDQSIEFEDAQSRQDWLDSIPRRADSRTPKFAMESLMRDARNARRLTVHLRFSRGSDELDSKAMGDVARVAEFLRRPEMQGRPWYLVGFSDSAGAYAGNYGLSQQRAAAAAKALAAEGVRVRNANILARSWLAPVACNEDERGRALNRRVEVWIGERETPPATTPVPAPVVGSLTPASP